MGVGFGNPICKQRKYAYRYLKLKTIQLGEKLLQFEQLLVHFLCLKSICHSILETERREIRYSMVNLPVKLPSKPALSSHPHQHTNIIEITPSLQASDSGKHLCAYLLLFDKTYHFMKITCISCVILIMALYYPPFTLFLVQKWK